MAKSIKRLVRNAFVRIAMRVIVRNCFALKRVKTIRGLVRPRKTRSFSYHLKERVMACPSLVESPCVRIFISFSENMQCYI